MTTIMVPVSGFYKKIGIQTSLTNTIFFNRLAKYIILYTTYNYIRGKKQPTETFWKTAIPAKFKFNSQNYIIFHWIVSTLKLEKNQNEI